MKQKVIALSALLLIVCGFLGGCDRAGSTKDKPADDKAKVEVKRKESSPFQYANDVFKYPNNPRVTDDWTRFREGLQILEEHFSEAKVLARLRLENAEREFLAKEVHLNSVELGRVESTAFNAADAHYLDECYLMRDISRHLETSSGGPMDLAQAQFAWVMRNVILHENTDTWVPPAFVLRHGCGGAVDRALVFLSLVRQAQLEGCLVVVPDTEPLRFLIAVHDAPTNSLRLFDPYLERPIRNKDGSSVATLKEALEDPALFQGSQISAEDVKKLEVWMVCPLHALSPRMRELQTGLGALDSLNLFMAPAAMKTELAKATTLPIKVWNAVDVSQPPDSAPPNSPTRTLRMFLPKGDGGIDAENRLFLFRSRALLPLHMLMSNYAQIRLTSQLLPRPVFEFLVNISFDLLGKYDMQTRELYLRGQYEPMMRRYERILQFTNNQALVGLMNDPAFAKERAEWQERIRNAYANVPAEINDPRLQAKIQLALQAEWAQDQFVGYLLQVEKEDKLDRQHKKSVLTRILAVGLQDYLEREVARAQASMNYERAAKMQSASKPSKNRLAEAWGVAKGSWGNFYSDRIAIESMIQQRLDQIREQVPPGDIDSRLGLLEQLHFDVQKYFHARMRLTETMERTDSLQASKDLLVKTKEEIERIEKSGLLKKEIDSIRAALPQPAPLVLHKRLDLLNRDWAETGNYVWLKRRIDVRTKS